MQQCAACSCPAALSGHTSWARLAKQLATTSANNPAQQLLAGRWYTYSATLLLHAGRSTAAHGLCCSALVPPVHLQACRYMQRMLLPTCTGSLSTAACAATEACDSAPHRNQVRCVWMWAWCGWRVLQDAHMGSGHVISWPRPLGSITVMAGSAPEAAHEHGW